MVKCDSCGANVDLAKDSNMGHCASCNNIVEVRKEQSSDGRTSEQKTDDGDKPEAKEEVKK
ncbi:hypothetical protein LTR85_008469 [Meristemomyces frigidus]|nr:hypothetical protein LTR85_008469 [Meristemomyces frigidus]